MSWAAPGAACADKSIITRRFLTAGRGRSKSPSNSLAGRARRGRTTRKAIAAATLRRATPRGREPGPKALPVDTPRASCRTAPAVCALALDPCVVVGKLMFWRRLGGIEPATTMKHGCWRSLSKAGPVPRHRRSYPKTPMFQDKKVPERPCSKMCHCWCRIARIHGLALCGRYGACNFSIHRSSRPRVAKGPFLHFIAPIDGAQVDDSCRTLKSRSCSSARLTLGMFQAITVIDQTRPGDELGPNLRARSYDAKLFGRK